VVTALIETGADVNIRSKVLDGMPPLRKTAPDVGQQGIHSTFPKGGMTAVLFAARQGSDDAIAAFARAKVDLNQKDPDGFTPLIFAILNGHYNTAALLVEKGAGIDVTDASGRTPLYTAVDMNSFGARSTARPRSERSMDAVDLVKFLLAHGATQRAADRSRQAGEMRTAGNPNLIAGATPLMKAVRPQTSR
jgi:ankyrin repeat protein